VDLLLLFNFSLIGLINKPKACIYDGNKGEGRAKRIKCKVVKTEG
jgi:hypothetical protein